MSESRELDVLFDEKRNLKEVEKLLQLIGSKYSGGGGGVGRVFSINNDGITIYHQKYNGPQNYHNIYRSNYKEFFIEFDAVLLETCDKIALLALEKYKLKLKEKIEKFKQEFNKLDEL